MTQWFEKNVALFEFKNARAAALLSCVDPQFLEPCYTEKGEDNLKRHNTYLHSQKGAYLEAVNWAKKVPLTDVDVLVVYGVGLGYAYQALKGWLNESASRKLLILEDDLGIIFRFLEKEAAHVLLSDSQVQLYYIEDSLDGAEVLKGISWATFNKKMHIVAVSHYQETRQEVFEEIKARLLYEQSDIHAVCDEYTNYGISYFRNFWRNIFLLDGSCLANNLKGQFRAIPAIVVAAGPSLKTNIEELKQLHGRALVFSGGSSVNALTEAGIMPHFGGGIDPNPLQYMRLRQNLALQVPFFYRSRMLHEAASLISGDRLYLRGGDGYNIATYFEKKAKISGPVLGGGHSIANFGIEIAYALGCSPIILVGFDLAYGEQKQRYAPGVEESHPSNIRQGIDDESVVWKDSTGKSLHTAWKWILEGQWIEEFAKKHGKKRFINATQAGLGIQGIAHMSLKEAVDRYCKRSYDLDALVHTAIQQAGVCTVSHDTLFTGMAKIFDSLSSCIGFLDTLLEHIGATRINHKSTAVPFLEKPDTILLLQKLENQLAFKYILEVFDRMKTKLDFYTLQFHLNANSSEQEKQKLELDLLGGHYYFLKEVCIVNQALIGKSIQEQQSLGHTTSAFVVKEVSYDTK